MTCTKQLRILALGIMLTSLHLSSFAQGSYDEAPFEEEEFKGPNRRSADNEVNPPLCKAFVLGQNSTFPFMATKCFMV